MNILKYLPLLAAVALVGCGKSDSDRASAMEAQAADPAALLREIRAANADAAMRAAEEERLASFRRELRRRDEHLNRYGRVRLHGNGTVTIHGRQWMRCSLGQQWRPDPAHPTNGTCSGKVLEVDWAEAVGLVRRINAGSGFAGHTDWRLPSTLELTGLRLCSTGDTEGWRDLPEKKGRAFLACEGRYARPTIDSQIFPNTPRRLFWATPSRVDHGAWRGTRHRAWLVDFGDGRFFLGDQNKKRYRHVRLVRDGG